MFRQLLHKLKGKRERRVVVAGLDCGDPYLLFERWPGELPTFRYLMERGAFGPLTSSIPAITVPAWSSMFSGKDPGTLGFYGFRNRANFSYYAMEIATGASMKEPRVWDLVGNAGKRVAVVGVPQTYPVRPVNGLLVSGFLTPSTERNPYTYPLALKDEIETLLGHPYPVDVADFRTNDKEDLLRRIRSMTADHFRVVHHLMERHPWDLFAFVEIGVDRLHHGFWKYHDPLHPKHEPGNPFEGATLAYYKEIDAHLARILERMDDDTVLMVVSDHGGQAMQGGFCINEWLRQQGYLVLLDDDLPEVREEPAFAASPEGGTPLGRLRPFERVDVDWSRTRAWGAGGYYGRIFVNVAGREPEGVVHPSEYEGFRDRLAEELAALAGPDGRSLGTVCYKPEEIYHRVRNVPPDLIVYLGEMRWRAVGSLGGGALFTRENDTGPDDANHAQEGMIAIYDPRRNLKGRRIHPQLMDVAPTILNTMGVPIPEDIQGEVIEL